MFLSMAQNLQQFFQKKNQRRSQKVAPNHFAEPPDRVQAGGKADRIKQFTQVDAEITQDENRDNDNK